MWNWSGTFGSVGRKYLSKEEVAKVQEILDRFVGLPLTDVWYMYGRIFEFGEQKHFINRSGEDSYCSLLRVKALNGFTVKGFSETELTEKNFADSDRNWTDLAMEFAALWRKNDMIVQSAYIGRDGKIDFEMSHGITIAINGRTWTREFDIWHLVCHDESFLYHPKGIAGGSRKRRIQISEGELGRIKLELGQLIGKEARSYSHGQDVRIKFKGANSQCVFYAPSDNSVKFRHLDKIVHWDNEEFLEFWEGNHIVDSIKVDDQGTLGIWMGDWVMVFLGDEGHGWRCQLDQVEINCSVPEIKIIPC